MKELLVIYVWKNKYEHGYGNAYYTVDGDVLTSKNIRELERQLCEKFNYEGVVVLNIIELGDEEQESEDTE